MRYYKDTNGEYYYLEDSGRKIYNDKIVELVKEVGESVGPSDIDVTSSAFVDVKTLLDEMLQKFLIDNQII